MIQVPPIVPVYIDDIIGDIVAATQEAVIRRSISGNTTLLDQIKANETAALGETFIQQIRYSKSSFDELVETLSQADQSPEERFNKYPLVHFVQDYTVQRGQDAGAYGGTSLNIIFIHQTKQTYKILDRDTHVFKPVLWPIYYEFFVQLFKSGWTWGNDTGEYRHSVTKRAFWGTRKLKGSTNILNEHVDAIEVQNLQVKFNYSNCK